MNELKNIQKLAKMLDGKQLLSTDDLAGILTDIVNAFAQHRSASATINQDTKNTLNTILKQLQSEHQRIVDDVANKIGELKSTTDFSKLEEQGRQILSLKEQLQSIVPKDGRDGKNGRDGAPGKNGKDGKNGSPDTGEQIVDKINSQDKQIDASKIKGLPQPVINHIHEGSFNGGETPIKDSTGKRLSKDSSGAWILPAAGAGSGTVTGVSVASSNGFTGTSDGNASTPTLTLTTSVTGLLKGNGTAISAASAGTDYVGTGAVTTSGLTMNTGKVLMRDTAGVGAIEEAATNGSGAFLRVTSGAATNLTLTTPILGTPQSGTLTNCTGLPVAGITSSTSTALGVGSIELGHASDTTLARGSAGVLTVEGATVATLSTAQTWTATQTEKAVLYTNDAITATANAATIPITHRLHTVTNNSAATLTITLTTASATDGQMHLIRIYDFSAVAQTITWVNTENSTVSAPTTSNGSTTLPLTVGFMYNSATSKWRCIASV